MRNNVKKIWHIFKGVLHQIGAVQNFILLTIVYFVVVGVVSIVGRLTGKDFLNVKFDDARTFWKTPQKRSDKFEDFLHQF